MANWFKQTKAPTGLIQLISANLSGVQPARTHKIVHASSVTQQDRVFCPREYALLDVTKKKRPDEFLDTAKVICFAQGEALSEYARNKWLRNVAVGH